MTVQISSKDKYIELFRKNGFNCFPIPNNMKIADSRYQASRTIQDQPITENENYGIIPILGKGNCIIDYDDKEKYRKFAEHMKKEYMVIETGRGWHIPVIGLTGNIKKIELFDYNYQPNEKIIEIQGPKHYCVGVGSVVLHDKLEKIVNYENKGTDKIYDVKGKDFHVFIDELCIQCKVEGKKKKNAGSYQYLRDRFDKGLIPLKGSSNDYFFQAAIQCNTEELTKEEALSKIKIIYHKWSVSEYFSERPWSNIESKINEVYEKNLKTKLGRPKGSDNELNRTSITRELLETKKIYSDKKTHDVLENKNGFLERINDTLKTELIIKFPEMEESDYKSVLFKLEAEAENIPPTNRDLIKFMNGVFSKKAHTTIETEELADMGFNDYNYLPKTKENEPIGFIKVMFGNTPKNEHTRIKAGLRSTISNYLDPKISTVIGLSGVGKSTGLNILIAALGEQYAFPVELKQLLEDKFIKAKIVGKRLIVLQDLPKDWKDFAAIKALTGENRKTERGFHQDSSTFDNKIKIWATGNYLAKIPEEEKDAMYTRRLSLVHNTRTEAYDENPEFEENIIQNESEKIISWILNLTDNECKYENKATIRDEWEGISSPEIAYLEKYWQLSDEETEHSVMKILNDCREKTKKIVSIEQLNKSLKGLGYVVKYNIIKNIEIRPESFKKPVGQTKSEITSY